MKPSLYLAFVAATLATGCTNLFRSLDPCHDSTPVVGGADIEDGKADGTMDVKATTDTTYTFVTGTTIEDQPDCVALVSGTAAADGSGTISYYVSCKNVTVTVPIPDVRTLAQGSKVVVVGSISNLDDVGGCSTGSATVTIEKAVGSESAEAPFVTSDFVRTGTVVFDSTAAAGGGDAGSAACATQVTLRGTFNITADNYSQELRRGPDHCPDLPQK